MSTEDMTLKRKRLIYQSNYRGFKEADLILGGFAKAHMHELTDAEVLMFEDLLEAKDHDIYDWITQKLPVPANYDTTILERLRAFDPKA
ncbi:succinate dehydrogenase assembly factor 2 [Litorimonas sp. RW-G-Af-16]|uniref:succinate dehydrogenase assembly factor 2 n=1 Tax=Litorimonas sp. RW-G-Af-16 TaxID=3241168 RepID=UPI00390C6906